MKPRNSTPVDDEQRRLAVLIDADNAQPAVIEGLLEEVAKYGVASAKRIYGNFTSQDLSGWKDQLLKYSIQPMQQFAYTKGKNATDSSLIIDAMDLMYTGRFDGFCLVSSDSDFTRLAQRLREGGLTVYGFGERKTPDAFVQACDKFIYTEVLRAQPAASVAAVGAAPKKPAKATRLRPRKEATLATVPPTPPQAPAPTVVPAKPSGPLPLPVDLLRQVIEEASDDEGWAHLGAVGSYLNKIRPDFDPRLYGQKKLSDLLRQHPRHFEMQERVTAGGTGKTLFVRAVE